MNIPIAGMPLLLAGIIVVAIILAFIFFMRNVYARRSVRGLTRPKSGPVSTALLSSRNKYPEVNVFRLSGTFLNLGLAVALVLTIMAFNWTQYERQVYIPKDALAFEDDLSIEPPRTIEQPPPPLPPPPPVIEEVPNEEIIEEEVPDFFDQSVEEKSLVPPPAIREKKLSTRPALPPPPELEEPEIVEIFKVVEEMPRFPGCEELATLVEKKQCADGKMLEFIYRNIEYPAIARENGVEGMVVVTFVVEKNGEVTGAQILRDIGAQCGQEALRVVNLMNQRELLWTPGQQRGRAVRVQFNLPVKFKLE